MQIECDIEESILSMLETAYHNSAITVFDGLKVVCSDKFLVTV